MNKLLERLAMESGLIEEHEGNPEEITIYTDSTETELEEVVQQMAEDVEKAEEQSDAAEKMIDVIESLESKIVALRAARDRGENMNAMAAMIYSSTVVTSMESRGFPRAVFADEVNQMNTSFEATSSYDYSVEAEEKTQGILDKIKTLLKKALNAFVLFWKDVMNRLRGFNKGIVALGNKVIERTRTITGRPLEGAKISVSGLALIEGDAVKALKDIEGAAGKVTSNEDKLATIVKGISLAQLKGESSSAAAKDVVDIASKIETTIELTGGIKLKWDETSDNGKFVLDGKAKEGDKEASLEIATVAGITEIGKALVSLGSKLAISEADQQGLISKLETSITQLIAEMGKSDDPKSSVVLKAFNKSLSALRTGRVLLNSHAQKTAKQAYRYATMCIARHGNENAAAMKADAKAKAQAEKEAKKAK